MAPPGGPPPSIAQEARPDGQAIFMSVSCNMCHSVPALGIQAKATSEKMKGPDIAGIRVEPQELAKYLRGQSSRDGKRHLKEFKGTDEELRVLVAWVLAQK